MSTTEQGAPALGARENWWGDESDQADVDGGHSEVTGTAAADFIVHQLLLSVTDPICERTLGETGEEVELSEPCFYLPKQREIADGVYVEYRQHRHRHRVNEETGWVNWGESTATAVPQVGREKFFAAVHSYLAKRLARKGLTITNIEDYHEQAGRFWHDQQLDSHGSLKKFVEYVREAEGE